MSFKIFICSHLYYSTWKRKVSGICDSQHSVVVKVRWRYNRFLHLLCAVKLVGFVEVRN